MRNVFLTPSGATSWLFHGVWCVLMGLGSGWVVECTWIGDLLGEQCPWPHVPLRDSAEPLVTAGAPVHKVEVNTVVILGEWLGLLILNILSICNDSVFLRRVFQVIELERSCVMEGRGSAVCHLWSVKDGEGIGGNTSGLVWGLHQQCGNRSEMKCALIEWK